MKRHVGTLRLIFAALAVMALALGALPVAAARPAAILNGAGTALLTYTGTDLTRGPHPASYRIVGIVGADGSRRARSSSSSAGLARPSGARWPVSARSSCRARSRQARSRTARSCCAGG